MGLQDTLLLRVAGIIDEPYIVVEGISAPWLWLPEMLGDLQRSM